MIMNLLHGNKNEIPSFSWCFLVSHHVVWHNPYHHPVVRGELRRAWIPRDFGVAKNFTFLPPRLTHTINHGGFHHAYPTMVPQFFAWCYVFLWQDNRILLLEKRTHRGHLKMSTWRNEATWIHSYDAKAKQLADKNKTRKQNQVAGEKLHTCYGVPIYNLWYWMLKSRVSTTARRSKRWEVFLGESSVVQDASKNLERVPSKRWESSSIQTSSMRVARETKPLRVRVQFADRNSVQGKQLQESVLFSFLSRREMTVTTDKVASIVP